MAPTGEKDPDNPLKVRERKKQQQGGGPMMNNFTQSKEPFGTLDFDRQHIDGEPSHMGKCWRSVTTGEVFLGEASTWPPFDIVDIWARRSCNGTLRQVGEDPYLFVAVPMPYRTWAYHETFLDRKVVIDEDVANAMVKEALQNRCIDVPISAGRWSPVMVYGPMMITLCLTGDMALVTLGVLVLLAMWGLSWKMNNPSLYGYLRFATLLPRAGYLALLAWRFPTMKASVSAPLYVAFFLIALDIAMGDLQQIRGYRMNCSYEVVRVLPSRIFVCKRIGGSHLEDIFGSRGIVDPHVSGLGSWPKNHYLIADIKGMLVELRPFDTDLAVRLWHEHEMNPTEGKNKCLSMDAFSFDFPSAHCLDIRTHSDLVDYCAKFKQDTPASSLLRGKHADEVEAPHSDNWAAPQADTGKEKQPPKKHHQTAHVVETEL